MTKFDGAYAFRIGGLEAPPPFLAVDEAQAFLRRVTSAAEISNVAYLGVSLPNRSDPLPYLISTYPAAWARHYFAERYLKVDPAISKGLSGILPFDWHSVPTQGRAMSRFFGEALDFGLGWNGLSIPIRGALGERALFSINSPLLSGDWQAFKTANLGELTIFAYLFHLRILELERAAPPPAASVSPREKDVLRWAAHGKSSWETAAILGLTENTVNFYIRNVATKLQAANKTQAVAIALRSGLL